MSNPGAQAQGPISIDEAAGILSKENDTPEAEAAPEKAAPEPEKTEETESKAEPAAEDADGAETQTEGEEAEETEDAEAEEVTQPAIEPPKFWDKEAKDRFKTLDPEVQKIIIQKEDERNKATARALQEAAEQKRTFDTEAAKYAERTGNLAKLIPDAEDSLKIYADAFNQKWGNVDWVATVEQHGAEATQRLRFQMEQEQAHLQAQYGKLQQLKAARAEAEQAEFTKFVADEAKKLEDLAPELTDAKHGEERKQQLGKFLLDLGIPAARIPKLTAIEAALAYDAMKWRNGQAAADKLINQPKPVQVPKRTPAKPAAAPQASPQSARLQTLLRKGNLSTDEAVELMALQGT